MTEVLKVVDGKVPLIIELKYKEKSKICEKTDEILKQYHGAYCIESFHPQVLLWYRKHRPQVCRGQLSMNYQKEEGWRKPQYYILRHLLLNFLTNRTLLLMTAEVRMQYPYGYADISFGVRLMPGP